MVNSLREKFLEVLGDLSIDEIISNHKLIKKGERVMQILNTQVML